MGRVEYKDSAYRAPSPYAESRGGGVDGAPSFSVRSGNCMDTLHAEMDLSRRSCNGGAWHGGENNNSYEKEPDMPGDFARPLTLKDTSPTWWEING